jgi:hypothetical protein
MPWPFYMRNEGYNKFSFHIVYVSVHVTNVFVIKVKQKMNENLGEGNDIFLVFVFSMQVTCYYN